MDQILGAGHSQLNEKLFNLSKVEELINQKEELKIRIDSILSFEFPLVTKIHEYHEFLLEEKNNL